MPCGDKHVNVPCGRLRSVTRFPKLDNYYIVMNTYLFVHVFGDRVRSVTKLPLGDKRSNMPSRDKHVNDPCGRLRSVTKNSHIALVYSHEYLSFCTCFW